VWLNKIIDNNVMSKPNSIDAGYLGVCICLNPQEFFMCL